MTEGGEQRCGRGAEATKRTLVEALGAIGAGIDGRESSSAAWHGRRVAKLAVAIGRHLGLNERDLDGVRVAALLHDIGKLQVPLEILRHPGPLNGVERRVMESHPVTGYNLLREVSFPWPVADVVHQHHERLDGSGYPQGLRGEAILPQARILAVADIVETATSPRPYHTPLLPDAIRDEIRQDRGRLLDADAVDACTRLLQQEAFRRRFGGQ